MRRMTVRVDDALVDVARADVDAGRAHVTRRPVLDSGVNGEEEEEKRNRRRNAGNRDDHAAAIAEEETSRDGNHDLFKARSW